MSTLWKMARDFPWSHRQFRELKQRTHSREDFSLAYGPDSGVAASVWDALREYCAFDGFSPKPEDRFLDMYGLCEGDLDDFAEQVFVSLGVRWPSHEEARGMPSVETVDDLIRFVVRFRDGEVRSASVLP